MNESVFYFHDKTKRTTLGIASGSRRDCANGCCAGPVDGDWPEYILGPFSWLPGMADGPAMLEYGDEVG